VSHDFHFFCSCVAFRRHLKLDLVLSLFINYSLTPRSVIDYLSIKPKGIRFFSLKHRLFYFTLRENVIAVLNHSRLRLCAACASPWASRPDGA
jgi:hypothetical protein